MLWSRHHSGTEPFYCLSNEGSGRQVRWVALGRDPFEPRKSWARALLLKESIDQRITELRARASIYQIRSRSIVVYEVQNSPAPDTLAKGCSLHDYWQQLNLTD